jgi:dolichyl-phosphate-mannose--protein O-mannosyl transferase
MGDGFKDTVIHYGQKLRIKMNPLLIDRFIYLYSEPSSINRYSLVSRLQEVIFMLKNNYNTVWTIEHSDPNQRLEMEGKPIKINDSVLLRHEMTNQWLAADTVTYGNSFGE